MHTHDRGLTWDSQFSVIEKANFGVDAAMTSSYGSVFGRADGSRLFAVYTFNSHNLTGVPGAKPNVHWMADMMGPYSLRYSDDLGQVVILAHLPLILLTTLTLTHYAHSHPPCSLSLTTLTLTHSHSHSHSHSLTHSLSSFLIRND